MSLRYLFGPVDAEFGDQNLSGPRQAGACRTFDWRPGADIVLESRGSWEELNDLGAWRPDLLVLFLQYRVIPEWLWEAPVPIVALAGDWNLLWHHYRRCLWRADRVFTDAAGVEVLTREGMTHARAGILYGLGRAFVDEPPDVERDIDVLFVGNFHAAIQQERLAWLGRVARLAARWKFHITTGVFGEDYRRLLARARIVVNRGIRGEANHRTFEALAGGALLFQESSNREVPRLLTGEECVFYDDDNLEERLTHCLENEGERQRIAAAGHARVPEFTFDRFWHEQVNTLEKEWDQIVASVARRQRTARTGVLLGRAWQRVSATFGTDSALEGDLKAARQDEPRSSALAHALAFASDSAPASRAQVLQEAWQSDPAHVVAGLNLAIVLEELGQKAFAVEQAQRTLAMLARVPNLGSDIVDAIPYPGQFDELRVAWERAAWTNAGDRSAEGEDKRVLIRWRLELLLARLTEDPLAAMRACMLRSDLTSSHTVLAGLLMQSGRALDAIEPLRVALRINPFACETARILHRACGLTGRGDEQLRLVSDRRLLSNAAPALVPSEPWFHEAAPLTLDEPPSRPCRIVWQGTQDMIHSLATVNRQLCRRLVRRGHSLSLRPSTAREAPAESVALPEELRDASRREMADADVHIRHQWPPDFTPPPSGHFVVIQPWEFGSLPSAWVEPILKTVDEVWVPSHFVRNTFVNSGIPAELVHVVPNGVDDSFFDLRPDPFPLKTGKRFKFLFVGGTLERKGFDLLLKAYGQVFSGKDDVCLVVKDMGVGTFYQGQTAGQHIAAFRARPGAPEIEYITAPLTDEQMAGLYAACDCLVHPFRGEGFGLPIAEAMACGLPVITTAFGPTLDYCEPDAAYLVPARASPFAANRVGDMPTVGQPFLAQPDQDSLRHFLRQVVRNPDEGRSRGRIARQAIRAKFTWDHAVRAVERRIESLLEKPIRRLQGRETLVVSAGLQVRHPRVSLCMIVKNEEANLPACLESVRGLSDETIVVDTGSTDRTREFALGMGARVFEFPWVDSFAAARNESLRHATGAWIFWMDADDRLDAANREKLRELIARLPDDNVGFAMKCLCLPDPETGTATVVDHIRLFRNDPRIRWRYRIHEQILLSIRESGGKVGWTDIVVHHVGYQDSGLRRRKLDRDIRLLNLENQEHPDDPFTLFNLGSVYLERKEVDQALAHLRRSLELSAPTDSIVRKLYSLVSQCERQLGHNLDALKTCLDGRKQYPEDSELLFQESLARRELGDAAGAESCLLRLRGGEEGKHFASVDTGLRGYKALHNLAVICQDQKRWSEAEAHWKAALAERPDYLPGHRGLAEVYLNQRNWEGLDEACRRLALHSQGKLDALVYAAKRHLALEDFARAKQDARDAISIAPKAIWPRVVLSHIYLKEGRDWRGAEEALRAVLELDPNHGEAKSNLDAVRLRQASEGR